MQLVKYFFILFLVVLCITTSVTWLVNKGLQRSGVDFYGKINAAMDTKRGTSLLLVGSSRTLVHLNPQIIDSITGLNSFNYGLNSGTIKTWYNIIKSALQFQKNAQAVILNIDYNTFDIDTDPYKDAYYYPFEAKVPGLQLSAEGTINMVHKLKLFDVSLYDDYAKYAAIDGWLRPKRVIQGVYKGYFPYPSVIGAQIITAVDTAKKELVLAPSALNLLKECISLCKKNKVKMILLMAPYLKKYSPDKSFLNFIDLINRINEIAKQNEVPFYNYSNSKLSEDQKYFYNVTHLNIEGANSYSIMVADTVKKYLSIK